MSFEKIVLFVTFALLWTALAAQPLICVMQNETSDSIADIADGYFRYAHEKCWEIIVPLDHAVTINITNLDLYGRECIYAYLKLTVAETGEEYRFCKGNSTDELITATSNVVVFYYIYSYNYIYSAFNLSYEIENLVCHRYDSFRCSDGTCIPRSKVCDGVKDCPDGEDEEGCDNPDEKVVIEGAHESRQRAIAWLKSKYTIKFGWGEDTPRALVALSLAGGINFSRSDWREEVMVKEIDVQTSMALLRNCSDPESSISPDQLSMFLNGLIATCRDPRGFHGLDLVYIAKNEAQKSPIATLPAVYLAVCNANESLPADAVDILLRILNSPSGYPFLLDVQAFAVMALSCVKHSSKNTHYFNNVTVVQYYDWTVKRFMQLQAEDGTFGNVYTTAIITQALISSHEEKNKDWNYAASVKYLMKWLNSTEINFLSAYLTLPILSGKSLINVADVTCSAKNSTNGDDILNKGGPKMRIQYSLFVGDQMDAVHTIAVKVPVNCSAYEAMKIAAALDPKYKFQSRKTYKEMYIYEIANIANDPEAGKFWLLYYISKYTGGNAVHAMDSPDQFVLYEEEHLIMWYKTANI